MEKRANFSARRDEDLARYVEMLLASVEEIREVRGLDQSLLERLALVAEDYQDSLVAVNFYRTQAAAAAERKDRTRIMLEEELVPFVEMLRQVVHQVEEKESVLVA